MNREQISTFGLSRRRFLKGAGVAFLAGAVGVPVVSEGGHLISNLISRSERNKFPALLSEVLVNSVAFGFSPDHNNLSYIDEVGIRPHIVNFFLPGDGSSEVVMAEIKNAQAQGYTVMLSCGTVVTSQSRSAFFDQIATNLSNLPEPFLLRPFYEMNGHWTKSWYMHKGPDDIVNAWREMRELFADKSVNCKFVFCPNTTEDRFSTDFIDDYYPGGDYVDYVGLDTYNKHSVYIFDSSHTTVNVGPEERLAHDIATLQELAAEKSFLLCESGARKEVGRADEVIRSIRFAVLAGAKAVMTFEWNKKGKERTEINWSMTAEENTLLRQAVIAELEKDYFLPRDMKFQI